ncbi:MAG TPA: hypothetical protein VGX28_10800 [Frankiaceae bacterium]|jgi:hypothetical protein|nr:hypothetical protein [Frankiaceae bacterium]
MRATTYGSAAALAALLALGCSSAKDAAPAAAPGAAAAPRATDKYRVGDVRFFTAFQYPEAAEVEVYDTLDAALGSADVVLLGRVTDVRVTRTVGVEEPLPMYGVTVQPAEVLRGTLPAAHAAAVTVEFLSSAASPEDLRRGLPNGYSVWVLRRKGSLRPGVVPKRPLPTNERDYYRLVSSQALFVQGESHVVNPLEHDHGPEIPLPGEAGHSAPRRDPVIVGAEQYATLSSFAAHARNV